MLSYIIRRLLYSIVVLIAASMLVFTFVAKTGDPLAALATSPNVSKLTVQNIRERKHLDAPLYERYYYWATDAATNQFGTTLLTNQPILPEPLARDEEHAPARVHRRGAGDPDRRSSSASTRRYASTRRSTTR